MSSLQKMRVVHPKSFRLLYELPCRNGTTLWLFLGFELLNRLHLHVQLVFTNDFVAIMSSMILFKHDVGAHHTEAHKHISDTHQNTRHLQSPSICVHSLKHCRPAPRIVT